jgi:rRNA maturation protein Nop10
MPKRKCKTCGGWGWNQTIKTQPIDLVVPVPNTRAGFEALKEYTRKLLCCPDCGGSGRVTIPARVRARRSAKPADDPPPSRH